MNIDSSSRALFKRKGLSILRPQSPTRQLSTVGRQKTISLSKQRGLKDINKINLNNELIYDEEIENEIEKIRNEVETMIRMSPDTQILLNSVYTRYSDLYYNDRNAFNRRMTDIKFINKGQITKEDILDDLRDRKYYQKHKTMNRPKKIQYKREIRI